MCQIVRATHYTIIGDAGGVPLQRCEPSECGSAHYTKIGDAGGVRRHVCSIQPLQRRRRGLWTSLALLKWVAAHVDR